MTRVVHTIYTDAHRAMLCGWVMSAPVGTRVEFKAPRRSIPQNDRMWEMLTCIAQQVEWYGQHLSPEDWKDVMTASLRKARVVPGLDAGSFVPLGMRTSDMSKAEMSALFELMEVFAAERGVTFPWHMEKAYERHD